MEWKQNSILSGVEFCFEWSGISFQVEWKQDSVLSGVETEFFFEWSWNRIPFWCLGNGKFWRLGNRKFQCLGNGKFWCLGKISFSVLETEFCFRVTRKWLFCFLVFFCAYVLTYYGWSKNKIFEWEISCRNGNKIFEREILLHHHFPVLLTQEYYNAHRVLKDK